MHSTWTLPVWVWHTHIIHLYISTTHHYLQAVGSTWDQEALHPLSPLVSPECFILSPDAQVSIIGSNSEVKPFEACWSVTWEQWLDLSHHMYVHAVVHKRKEARSRTEVLCMQAWACALIKQAHPQMHTKPLTTTGYSIPGLNILGIASSNEKRTWLANRATLAVLFNLVPRPFSSTSAKILIDDDAQNGSKRFLSIRPYSFAGTLKSSLPASCIC